jgi:uncharacterized Tic20 family protein
MKKVLSILMVFGLLFTSQTKAFNVSQTLDSVKSIATSMKDSAIQSVKSVDTSSTFKLMYSDLKQGIGALASSLKVGAEHVYEVLVRQQIVYGIVYLFLSVIGFILILNWIKKYKDDKEKWITKDGYSGEDPTGLGIIRTIQIIIAFVMIGIGIFNIESIMTGFINPEYGAIQDVIEMVKDVKK